MQIRSEDLTKLLLVRVSNAAHYNRYKFHILVLEHLFDQWSMHLEAVLRFIGLLVIKSESVILRELLSGVSVDGQIAYRSVEDVTSGESTAWCPCMMSRT